MHFCTILQCTHRIWPPEVPAFAGRKRGHGQLLPIGIINLQYSIESVLQLLYIGEFSLRDSWVLQKDTSTIKKNYSLMKPNRMQLLPCDTFLDGWIDKRYSIYLNPDIMLWWSKKQAFVPVSTIQTRSFTIKFGILVVSVVNHCCVNWPSFAITRKAVLNSLLAKTSGAA